MSSPTDAAPVSAIWRCTARATSSRGASSSTNRSPVSSCSVAPSPRIASVIKKPSRPRTPITAVGWNCTSSRSASAAPAACARSSPAPCDPGGFVVRDHNAAAPPVAITTARATTSVPPSHATPAQRPSGCQSACARGPSSTSIRGSDAASADSRCARPATGRRLR